MVFMTSGVRQLRITNIGLPVPNCLVCGLLKNDVEVIEEGDFFLIDAGGELGVTRDIRRTFSRMGNSVTPSAFVISRYVDGYH